MGTPTAHMDIAIGAALGTAFHSKLGLGSMYMGTIAGALAGCVYMKVVEGGDPNVMDCIKKGAAAAGAVYVLNMVAPDLSEGGIGMIAGPAAAYFGTMIL